MDWKLRNSNFPVKPTSPVNTDKKSSGNVSNSANSVNFSNLLEKNIEKSKGDIQFSRHASERMSQRNIKLDKKQIDKLNEAVNILQRKGCRDSLVLMDSNAFVVNTPGKKVVTVVDELNLKENVFTNIDSAVII
jgi:flagellar operon protein